MKGGKVFVQLHSDEPLHECKVLGSAIGADEAEAVAAAMAKAGVTELATGPRPISETAMNHMIVSACFEMHIRRGLAAGGHGM
jgi:hypothetical protein